MLYFRMLLFCLYSRKVVKSLVIYHQKVSSQNFNPILPVIWRIFDLEYHGQTSAKVAFAIFGFVFMLLKKLKILHQENKTLNLHKA